AYGSLLQDRRRELHAKVVETLALWLLGELASRRERPEVEAAVSHYRRAMALGDALGMRPLIAHCHGGLAKLYRRTGHALEAQAHFSAATIMYREMDMRFWLEKAEAEIQELA